MIVTVAALVVLLGGGAAGYLLTRTTGSPQQTAASYLRGWQRGDYPAMGKVSVHVPPGGLAGPLRQYAAQLGQRTLHTRLGSVTSSGATTRRPATSRPPLPQRRRIAWPASHAPWPVSKDLRRREHRDRRRAVRRRRHRCRCPRVFGCGSPDGSWRVGRDHRQGRRGGWPDRPRVVAYRAAMKRAAS